MLETRLSCFEQYCIAPLRGYELRLAELEPERQVVGLTLRSRFQFRQLRSLLGKRDDTQESHCGCHSDFHAQDSFLILGGYCCVDLSGCHPTSCERTGDLVGRLVWGRGRRGW